MYIYLLSPITLSILLLSEKPGLILLFSSQHITLYYYSLYNNRTLSITESNDSPDETNTVFPLIDVVNLCITLTHVEMYIHRVQTRE